LYYIDTFEGIRKCKQLVSIERVMSLKLPLLSVLAALVVSAAAATTADTAVLNPPPISTVRPNPAHIVSVKMIAFRQQDPHVNNEWIDIFAVTVRNEGEKNFVRAILLAGKNGTPGSWPAIINGTNSLKFVAAKPPVWQVPLAPRKTKTIYFVARSTEDDTYCVGVNNAIWYCTAS
jgi:hypothetical protein